MMRRSAALFLILLGLGVASIAQTPQDPDEGSRIVYDAANQIYRFKWWGRAGRTYFILHSEDLQDWFYVPIVESGNNSIKQWGFTTNSGKFFIRLQYTSKFTLDPQGGDFDEDGVSNLSEVQQGSNPLNYYSQPGGMITPMITILSGNNQHGPPLHSLPQRLTIKVVNALTGVPLPHAPITFAATSGQVSRNTTKTDVTGRTAITFITPNTPGISTITSKASSASAQFLATTLPANAVQPPAAPSQFTSLLNPDGSRSISWTDNSNNENAFAIWTKDANGQWTEIGTVPANQTSATISANGTLVP